MRIILPLLCLYLGTGLVHADSATEFAAARASFEKLQSGLTDRVNRLDGELRAAIWTQYYLALERLRQMDVHRQMMERHQKNRTAQFNQAREEFDRAIDELERLLPPKPGPE